MKRELFALLTTEVDEVSLAMLGRAIAYAPRRDGMQVWRAFLRSRGDHVIAHDRTQRIKVHAGGKRE